MLLVVFGLTNMWAAVFADVGVTLIAVIKFNENNSINIDKE